MPELTDIFDRQHRLQVESFGSDPHALEGIELKNYLVTMTWALIDELSESMKHVNWKPWASIDTVFHDRDKYVKELVDALHFFVNLLLAARADGNEVYNRYLKKAEVNAQRQVMGYDGRSTKDPVTGEALDEPE